MASLSELVAESARDKLDLAKAKLRPEHFYASLPLCIVDAVFSIGVKYTGTTQTVIRWAKAQNPEWPLYERGVSFEHTVSDFVEAVRPFTAEALAETIFENRQRTSTKGGILKAEAVRQFALALRETGIERFSDIQKSEHLEMAEARIRKIKGQSSGISFDYFTLLAGNQMVKADRMIVRFVAEAAGVDSVSPREAKEATIGAARILQAEYPHVDTRLLDSEVWGFESAKAAARKRKLR
ncbi:MAG TPA: hypothetical protein VNX23_03795 [Bradyrhizobium sp.]|jgi:hypothetical protein|uniref:hypothetical protein n=1 Tax=Bradyrhizobium sp. TaxID=376 RepID=UPI002CC0715C|nr:hypothetical protein [Bradyrhizobium sp.]HXB76528.1 hypothetical protein [Bradyrhizobium sp.]